MESRRIPEVDKIKQDELVDALKFQSQANSQELELIYLVKRQKKESWCLLIQSSTLLVVIFIFLVFGWLISICPKLNDFIRVIYESTIDIGFDRVKDGKVVERSVKLPTEILILLTIFIWRFSPAAFLKKNAKSDLVENSSK